MFQFLSSIDAAKKANQRLHLIMNEKLIHTGVIEKIIGKPTAKLFASALKKPSVGTSGLTLKTMTGQKAPEEVWITLLPKKVSRHNSETQKENIYQATSGLKSKGKKSVVLILDDDTHFEAAVGALARHEQRIDYTSKKSAVGKVGILALNAKADIIKPSSKVKSLIDSVAWACALLDEIPEDLNPANYAKKIKEEFKGHKQVKIKEFVGDKLVKEGLMGVYTVGRAAVEAPRMLVLEYKPSNPSKKIGMIGKGLCYDSGGLSLKPSTGMFGMKMDMGGSSAVLGAFKTLVETKSDAHIICCVGLVENAIGPSAYRPDDVITMYSGKTVEINNTDAEGRLVLADCLAYIAKNYNPDMMLNAATLTGAQMIATGVLHAGICATEDGIEKLAFEQGKASGDLTMPMVFAPDILFSELESPFADMRNSVKSRMNAQSSCAAVFLYQHIQSYKGPWLHIDLAGPAATSANKGTGFGVHLITNIVENYQKTP